MTSIIVFDDVMSMTSYRLLVALADTGSVARAADLVGVAQPHASRTLRRLSEEHGSALTEPAGRGVRLTAAGVELVDRARGVVRDYDALAQPSADHGRTLTLAAHEPLSTFLLGAIDIAGVDVLRMLARAPGTIEHEVATGVADVGLTAFAVPRRDLTHDAAGQWTLRVAHTKALTGVPLAQLDWIVPVGTVAAGPVAPTTIDGWPADAPPRAVIAEVSSLASAMELASRGRGAVWLPTCVVDAHNRASVARRHLVVREHRGAPRVQQPLHIVSRDSAPLMPRDRQSLIAAVARFTGA